jgi:hypothetical protein
MFFKNLKKLVEEGLVQSALYGLGHGKNPVSQPQNTYNSPIWPYDFTSVAIVTKQLVQV